MSLAVLSGVAISFLLTFFFQGIEYAFIAANKPLVISELRSGSWPARMLVSAVKRSAWFIALSRLWYALAVFSFVALSMRLLIPFFDERWPWLADHPVLLTAVMVFIIAASLLFTVELIARSLFLINPDRMITVMVIPLSVFFVISFPVIYALVGITRRAATWVTKKSFREEHPPFALTDLNDYLRGMHGVKAQAEDLEVDKRIFQNALEFKTVRIRDCMIPRTEIMAVGISDGIQKLKQAFIESGHSKILVYRKSTDDILGYCHSSALFKKPQTIEEILTPIITAPETTLANELMIQFLDEHKSLALVMNEFGEISGMVSMEDIIEEIFGEIEDEHDEDTLVEQQMDDATFLLSGRLEIDYLNDTYHLNLPPGEYDTLGGLILAHMDEFPRAGDTVKIDQFNLKIQGLRDNRIGVVKVTLENDAGQRDASGKKRS